MSLHITGVNIAGVGIIHSWHLEQEGLVWQLAGLGHLASVGVEQVAIPQELAGESTEDQDIFVVSLDNSTALSIREESRVDLDQGPLLLTNMVVSLDGVDVLSGVIGNTAEDVDLLVHESAGAVVVSAHVEVWHLEPKIDVGVVHLRLHLGVVLLLS